MRSKHAPREKGARLLWHHRSAGIFWLSLLLQYWQKEPHQNLTVKLKYHYYHHLASDEQVIDLLCNKGERAKLANPSSMSTPHVGRVGRATGASTCMFPDRQKQNVVVAVPALLGSSTTSALASSTCDGKKHKTMALFGWLPASKRCFSLTPIQHQPPASQQYFSLTINQSQSPATSQPNEADLLRTQEFVRFAYAEI
jgi:hypothetical protein